MRSSIAILALVLSLHVARAAPADWMIDGSRSRIEFTGNHAGQDFTGHFQKWTGTIAFDPAALEQSRAVIEIDMASAKTGDNYKDGTLPQEEWLDVKHFPQARFETQNFTRSSEGHYEAEGHLTIKGNSVSLTLPFALKIEGADATMSGSATLDRIALGIGTKSDPNAEWVSREIKVQVTVAAHRN